MSPTLPLRRRGRYSPEFKAQVVGQCGQPGISSASVARAHGLSPEMLRRWVLEAARRASKALDGSQPGCAQPVPLLPTRPTFVPLSLAAGTSSLDIRIELSRGDTVVSVKWPLSAAAQCAAWLRELLP